MRLLFSSLSQAAAAQATANGAVTVNSTQTGQINSIITVNNAQNGRLTALESLTANHEGRLDIIETVDIPALDSRLDSAESLLGSLAFGGAWSWYHDFANGGGGYTGFEGTWVSGQGWVSDSGTHELDIHGQELAENQVTHVELQVLPSAFGSDIVEASLDGTNWTAFKWLGSGVLTKLWLRMPNQNGGFSMRIRIRATTANFTLKQARYLGRGADVPFD